MDIHPGLHALHAALPALAPAPPALDKAAQALRPQCLRTGQLLFAQGARSTAFYALAEGELALDMNGADGSGSGLDRLRGPALLGLAAFVTQRPSHYEARALSPCTLWAIPMPAYQALMDGWPGFARALLQRFAEHYDGNLRLLHAARHAGAAERIAQQLRLLARGSTAERGGWRLLAITQAELALRSGLSRQRVNALLREAAAAGWLQLGYGWLRWREPDAAAQKR